MINIHGWASTRQLTWAHLPDDDLKVHVVLIKTGVGALVREGTPLLKVVHDADPTTTARMGGSLLDEIVRDGARAMLARKRLQRVLRGPFYLVAETGFEPATSGLWANRFPSGMTSRVLLVQVTA
jgi:hypothetical protein